MSNENTADNLKAIKYNGRQIYLVNIVTFCRAHPHFTLMQRLKHLGCEGVSDGRESEANRSMWNIKVM